MSIDTSKKIKKVTVDGVEMQLAGSFNPTIPTSAAYFTFDGNAVTKYNGSDESIVIPRSYSRIDNPVTVKGLYVEKDKIEYFSNIITKVYRISLTNESGSVTKEYTSLSNFRNNIKDDFTDGAYITDYRPVIIGSRQTDFRFITDSTLNFQPPIFIKDSVFNSTEDAYNYIGSILSYLGVTFSGVAHNYTFYDGDDFQVTSIKGIGTAGILSNFNTATVYLLDNITSIGTYAFSGCIGLTSVYIPNSVTSIGNYAFASSGIYNLDIPNSVTSIGNAAFSNCTKMSSVRIPTTISTIGGILTNNTALTQVTFNNVEGCSITTLNGTFEGCLLLKNITLPNTLTTIGNYTFRNSGIETITIPSTVTSIGQQAFGLCKYLNSITFNSSGESTIEINASAFTGCVSLVNISLPEGLTTLNNLILASCKSLTGVTLPSTLTSLGYDAFTGCSSLISLTIPDSVTTVSANGKIISGCSSIKRFIVGNNNTRFRASNNGTCVIWKYSGAAGDALCVASASTVIPTDISRTLSNAFYNCIGLYNLIVPDNIVEISTPLLNSCTDLEKLVLPNNLNKINYTSTTDIYKYDQIVTACDNLQSSKSENGLNYIGSSNNDYMYLWKLSDDIPDNVIINENCKFIGSEVFTENTNVVSVTLPNNLTDTIIYMNSFADCNNLKNINFGNITEIKSQAFLRCVNLESINLPKTVTVIGTTDTSLSGYNPWMWCTNLTSITVDPDNSVYSGINNCIIEKSTKTVVAGCVNSTIPEDIKILGGYSFCGSAISSISIPNIVNSIDDSAFRECKSLTSVTIGSGVKTIGYLVFNGCSKLTTLTILATIPPTLKNTNAISSATTTIYIPAGTLSAYQAATNWSSFASKFVELS